jgi:hypothetical protein
MDTLTPMLARLVPRTSLFRLACFGVLGLCLGGAKCGGESTAPDGPSCETEVLRTEDGAADRCDLQACEACFAECGSDCVIMEAYPPRYACTEQHAYSLYDFCEGWEYPGDGN